jgi:hypothetical protein
MKPTTMLVHGSPPLKRADIPVVTLYRFNLKKNISIIKTGGL